MDCNALHLHRLIVLSSLCQAMYVGALSVNLDLHKIRAVTQSGRCGINYRMDKRFTCRKICKAVLTTVNTKHKSSILRHLVRFIFLFSSSFLQFKVKLMNILLLFVYLVLLRNIVCLTILPVLICMYIIFITYFTFCICLHSNSNFVTSIGVLLTLTLCCMW